MPETFIFFVLALFVLFMLAMMGMGFWRLALLRRMDQELQEQRQALRKLEEAQKRHYESLVNLFNANWADEPPPEPPPPPVAFPVPPPPKPSPATPEKVVQVYGLSGVAAASPPPKPISVAPSMPSQREYRWEPLPEPPPTAFERKASEFEAKALEALKKIWMWIVVGDEYRKGGASAEYAVATTWLLRVGIAMSVLAVGYFLKYSIDKHYLGPWAKVSLSLGAGAAMLLLGLKLVGKRYHLIAQGLLGGGIAALYLSFFAAFSWYKLIDPFSAFALMIMVTLVAGAVAVGRDSLLVAVFGIVGGYCTPALLNTGVKNYLGLHSYMLLLGVGVLGVAWRKDWKLLNLLSFAFTYALFVASLEKYDAAADFPLVMGFLGAFFVLFSAVPILFNLVNRQKSTVLELLATLANLTVFFSLGHHLIVRSHDPHWAAALSAALAAFYLVQLLAFINLKIKDRGMMVILSAMTAFCLTITFPLLLSGAWITAAWAALGCVFLWMGLRLDSKLLVSTAYVVYALAFGRLLGCDSGALLGRAAEPYWDGLLDRLLSFGAFTASLGVGHWLLRRGRRDAATPLDPDNDIASPLAKPGPTATAMFWGAAALLFVYLHFEAYNCCARFYHPAAATAMSAIWVAALLLVARRPALAKLALFLAAGLLLKIFVFDLRFWDLGPERLVYGGDYTLGVALARLLDFLPAAAALALAALAATRNNFKDPAKFFGAAALGLLFVYLTLELNTLLACKLPAFRAGGVSILWGVFALSLVGAGIARNLGPLRYAGLALFLATTLKVFFMDLQRSPTLWRIVALLVLGLVTLAGSFIYIKFKDKLSAPEPKT